MYTIGEISVDDSVMETKFACDLNACKGACCTFPGGRGAPLKNVEVAEIERAFPLVKEYLPAEHLAVIEREGPVDGELNNYATQCIDGKACVFVYYEELVAKCAFERAFHEGKTSWQKPISCHLFPIRIRNEGKEITYEFFSECAPALAKGSQENVELRTFVAAPLERAFGTSWTKTLNETLIMKRQ